MEFDALDRIAADAFDGYIVRKDLVRKFACQYPVPTYVCEFLLGRYCASTQEDEITEGLEIVERQLKDRAVRSGEEELFKARAQKNGSVKIIDIVSARLDAKTGSFLATLPSLQLKEVGIAEKMVHDNERMLTGGFYAEVDLNYDSVIAEEKTGRQFRCRCPASAESRAPIRSDATRNEKRHGIDGPHSLLLTRLGCSED